MKYTLIVFFMFPLWLNAQDCKLKKTTDPYTRETLLSTGFIQLEGASLSINADSKEIDFFFSMDGKEKCFSADGSAIVIFEGKKVKATYKNDGPVNCDGIFHMIFRNTPTQPTRVTQLFTQKITSIQFIGNNKSQVNVSFTEEEQQALAAKGDCLFKEAKGLIK